MRLPTEAWWQTWERLLAEVTPPTLATHETPQPTAWQLTRDLKRVMNRINQERRQHRKSRHQRRR
jgi:hypothetical protein